MQRIKNIEEVILQLKPYLKQYLESQNTVFKNTLFQCPNRSEHKNFDETPSAGFVPNTNEQMFHCFTCGTSSDIFGAYKFLENKEINGAYWYECVKELADRYGVKHELEPLKPEEQEFNNVQTFLQTLIKNANSYLVKNHPKKAMDYLKKRSWVDIIDHFQLGYLPDSPKVRKYIIDSFKKYPELPKYFSINIDKPDDFASNLIDRLIYPIKHRYGYILGIVDRSLSDEDSRPKYRKYYLKVAEKKGVLFNLNKTFKVVYIVEGASSVFTMYNKGIKNVVATLGTAFTEDMYQDLIKHGVEKIIICFDGDEPGQKASLKALELTQTKSDIKVLIKDIFPLGDPDDIITKEGVDKFKNIPEVSNFKYYLNKFKGDEEDSQEKYKKALFDIIISNQDAIVRDKMLKVFTQETGILKTTIIEEVEKYEKTKGLVADVGQGEILKEETALLDSIEAFEERALRSGRLKGIPTGFSIFDEKIDGLQTGLVLISGKWNTGKSAFMHSMVLNLLNDPTNYVLYFSIDDPVISTTIPRFLANLSRVAINTVSNPLYRIDKNETLDEATKLVLKQRRNEALDLLKKYSNRLGLKDATDGYDTAFIEKIIKVYKVIAADKKLIVFVDFLNMVNLVRKNVERTEKETVLAETFKHLAGLYDVPIVCTVEGTKGVADTTMHESNIKGSASLQYRSDLTLLLSSDFEASSKSEMYFYDDKNEAQPIVQVRISKNKMSSFRKSIYFKFYRDFSRFEECTVAEQIDYSRKD